MVIAEINLLVMLSMFAWLTWSPLHWLPQGIPKSVVKFTSNPPSRLRAARALLNRHETTAFVLTVTLVDVKLDIAFSVTLLESVDSIAFTSSSSVGQAILSFRLNDTFTSSLAISRVGDDVGLFVTGLEVGCDVGAMYKIKSHCR